MDTFKDRIAIVTGAGSGIGAAVSVALAQRGARVICADIAIDKATTIATEIQQRGGLANAARLDVTDAEQVGTLIADTVATYGRLDLMFNNAGISVAGDARDLTLSHWRKVLDVNLMGVVYGRWQPNATDTLLMLRRWPGLSRFRRTRLTRPVSTRWLDCRYLCVPRAQILGSRLVRCARDLFSPIFLAPPSLLISIASARCVTFRLNRFRRNARHRKSCAESSVTIRSSSSPATRGSFGRCIASLGDC
jgi:NAD(P)-dependent dehydrogenase (short-subunit alcohol dehydrogenase family)